MFCFISNIGLTTCKPDIPVLPVMSSTPLPASRPIVVPDKIILSPIQNPVSNNPATVASPSDCQVSVEINWPSKIRRKVLSKDLCSLGKMLCRGTYKQIARSAWRCKKLQKHFLEEIAKQVHKECSYMCRKETNTNNKKSHESCLAKTDKANIMNFSFLKVDEEMREKAPLCQLVLKAASLRAEDKNKKWIQSVGVAAAVCLKNRSKNMTAFQLILAIINKLSGFMVSIYTFI